MDKDQLVAELLLRGFKRHEDRDKGREVYINDERVVLIRAYHATIGTRKTSVDATLALIDHIGDQQETDNAT